MSEIRTTRIEDIKDALDYTPNVPNNWYIPAKQAWQFFAWSIKNLQCGRRFSNNEQANGCMDNFEKWIENFAITFGEEKRDESN